MLPSRTPGEKEDCKAPHEDWGAGSPLADGHDVQHIGEEDVGLGWVQDLLQPLVLHEVGHQQVQAFIVGGLRRDELEHGLGHRAKWTRGGPVVSTQGSPFPTLRQMKLKVTESCLTVCDPRDYTVHGILQARKLEWAAFPFSRGSSQPRD